MLNIIYNMESSHATKRKQDFSNFAAVNEVIPTGEFNSKKQRLSYEHHPINGEQTFYNGTNNTLLQMSNHSEAINNHFEAINKHINVNGGHLQEVNEVTNGLMKNGDDGASEEMECNDNQDDQPAVEVNGNVMSHSYGKYCSHGHLNMCTTYNVPCRYPRMYCHPGGMLEDRLSIYHGF